MKPSFVDRVVAWFDPAAGLRRAQNRAATAVLSRGYDGAKTFPTSDWSSAKHTSANAEIQGALAVLRSKSRDLNRNSPYAMKATNVIVSNAVGGGIMANIKGKNPDQVKKLVDLWKEVAESNKCDEDGHNNFYAMQALAMRSIVESGEIVGLKKITIDAPTIRILESDFIVTSANTGNVIQGIEVDENGRRVKYHLYKSHPGDQRGSIESVQIPVDQLCHAYRQDRPGQLRGVPWSHSVIETLKNFDDYQYATLVRQKIAACFGGFITTDDSNSLLSPSEQKARREAELQMSPGMVRFLKAGEGFQNANPPGVEGYAEFIREAMRAVAAGYGISYEAMTGDYSQVNFSSGRMGHVEFRRNLENWRWNILIPGFCDPYFQLFLQWAKLHKGANIEGVYVQWVPPAYVMIDPTKEVEALKREVRAGFKTYGQAVREQGLDPDETITEIAAWNKKFDDLKLSFDSDARRLSNVGFAHPKDTLPLLSDAENLKSDPPDKEEESVTNED